MRLGVSNAPKKKKIDDDDGDEGSEEYMIISAAYAMRGHRAPPLEGFA